MSLKLKNRLNGLLIVAMFLSVCAMYIFGPDNALAESKYDVTRNTLPNEVAIDDYSNELGPQGDRGWTYWYKTKDEGSEWTEFSDSEYDVSSKLYNHNGATLGHLSVVPAAGTALKRVYTSPKDAIVRFMIVLNAYNSDGHNVSDDVNFDGQLFKIEINGIRQNMRAVELAAAGTMQELTDIIENCDKKAEDYAEVEKVQLVNDKKGTFLAYIDLPVTAGVPVDFIMDPNGNEDDFIGEWYDGANLFIKSHISYYKSSSFKQLSNKDYLDETTMPSDFGPINYYINPSYNGSGCGMPYPNPYIDEFKGQQGAGGWYYKMRDPDLGILDMVYNPEKGKWLAPEGNPGASDDVLYIANNASVANYARPVIKAYKAGKTGIIRFVGMVQHGYWQATEFDGQKFYITNEAGEKLPFKYGFVSKLSDSDENTQKIIDPTSVAYTDAPDNELFLPAGDTEGHKYDDVYYFVAELTVSKGEFIYFYDDAVEQPWGDVMRLGIIPIYIWVDPDDMIGPEEFTPDTVFDELYGRGFCSKQGENSWYYLYGNVENDYYKQVLDNGNWTSGYGTENTSKTMTPAEDYDSIRAWRAENNGKVRVLGIASRPEAGGDGVTLNIYKKSEIITPLYSHIFGADELDEQQIMIGEPYAENTYLDVKAGDILFFVVKAGENTEKDMLNTKFYVVYTSRDENTSVNELGDKIPDYTEDKILDVQYQTAESKIQGGADWYKLFGSAKEYYKMKTDGTKWFTGYEGTIKNDVYAPSKKYQTINAYLAKSTGDVKVVGSIQKLNPGGNGVDLIISKLSAGVVTELKKVNISQDDVNKQIFNFTESVQAGDMLFFAVDGLKKVDNDEVKMKLFAYYASITETPELGDDIGDAEPPVKTVDEYIIDDITDEMFNTYMSANFESQGKNGWYYLYGIGDDYYEMKKDGNNWRGPSSDPYNMFEGTRGLLPGNIWDTIRAYQVPNDGFMRIFAHCHFWQGGSGDGARMIIKNITSGELIYDEIFEGGKDWTPIHTFASDEIKVKRGDVLFFILNKNGENNQCDNVAMGLYPMYTIKTSNETDYPEGGIGAKEFDDSAVPPEIKNDEERNSHVIVIPKPEGKTETSEETGCENALGTGNVIISILAILGIGFILRKRR